MAAPRAPAAAAPVAEEALARPPLALAVLALPLAGLVLVLVRPALDLEWAHHPAHFWLVLAAGGLTAALAYATATAARRRNDARVYLLSLAFLAAAGFLGLHALATPGVLLATPSPGFALATPVGLAVAAVLVAASAAPAVERNALALMRHAEPLRGALLAAMAVWGVLSLGRIPPLDAATAPERASGPLLALAVPAIALYALAVARYLARWRARPTRLLLATTAALVLLAEAMAAVAFARNWHASWWEWHVLMLVAFALVARSARLEWHEERFRDLYLDETAAGEREISVLFADLAGFTSFSEAHDAREVAAMLNEYFEVVIPRVVREAGGEIDRIIGDALMVTFNTRGDQPDHPARAVRAALALQEATAAVAAAHPAWPRFRVGVNTGEVAVGVLGAAGGRTHTAIGDAVNVAARLEGRAPVGGVALGAETARRVPGALVAPLGRLEVKGRTAPVEAFRLLGVVPPPPHAPPPRRRRRGR